MPDSVLQEHGLKDLEARSFSIQEVDMGGILFIEDTQVSVGIDKFSILNSKGENPLSYIEFSAVQANNSAAAAVIIRRASTKADEYQVRILLDDARD